MRCLVCKFWVGREPHYVLGGLKQADCRRHAPITDISGLNVLTKLWPKTDAKDWCGDFEVATLTDKDVERLEQK